MELRANFSGSNREISVKRLGGARLRFPCLRWLSSLLLARVSHQRTMHPSLRWPSSLLLATSSLSVAHWHTTHNSAHDTAAIRSLGVDRRHIATTARRHKADRCPHVAARQWQSARPNAEALSTGLASGSSHPTTADGNTRRTRHTTATTTNDGHQQHARRSGDATATRSCPSETTQQVEQRSVQSQDRASEPTGDRRATRVDRSSPQRTRDAPARIREPRFGGSPRVDST